MLLGFSNPALPKLGFCENRLRTTSERERESKRDSSHSFSFVDDNGDVGPTTGLVLSFQRQHHKRDLESEDLVQEMRVAVQVRTCI